MPLTDIPFLDVSTIDRENTQESEIPTVTDKETQLTFSQPIQFGQTMNDFLNTRIRIGEKDAELCAAILMAEIAPSDDAHDFYDLFLNEQNQSRISYTTRRKVRETNDSIRENGYGSWNYVQPLTPGNHRIAAKPGKIARRLCGWNDARADSEGRAFDVFASAVHATLTANTDDISIVTGSDIAYWYDEATYCRCHGTHYPHGTMSHSCMRHSYCSSYFGIYEKYADGMAVLKCPQCGDSMGRAILWTDIDGGEWIDRPYGNPANIEKLIQWAERVGRGLLWEAVGYTRENIRVAVPRMDFDELPYMDSLPQWCRTCETISTNGYACCDYDHHRVVLNGLNGTDHDGFNGQCENCGANLDADGDCRNSRYCYGCEERYCGDYCPNDCERCDNCGEWRNESRQCDCLHCPDCGEPYGTDTSALRGTRGCCPDCGYEIESDYAYAIPVDNPHFDSVTGHPYATCPDEDCRGTILLDPDHAISTLYGYSRIRRADDAYECPYCERYIDFDPLPTVPALYNADFQTVADAVTLIRECCHINYLRQHAADYRRYAESPGTSQSDREYFSNHALNYLRQANDAFSTLRASRNAS